jgi:hypothetical protein
MVTCCFCEPELAYRLATFLEDLNELMLYVAPVAICIVLWKVFVTNRTTVRGDVTVLGLDASSTTYSPLPEPGVSGWALLLYFFTSVLTFGLGLLAFETVQALS